jgi:hypothetical protein
MQQLKATTRPKLNYLSMSSRLLKFGIIGTILQIFLYWITVIIIQQLSTLVSGEELISDYALIFSIGLFGFLLLFQNILVSIFCNEKFSNIMMWFSSVLITLAWIEDIASFPFQTIICIMISIGIIMIKPKIDKTINKSVS